MKNPENKSLRIVKPPKVELVSDRNTYVIALSNLAVAESNLIRAGKDSALNHFIAIVKELERVLGFTFEIMEDACPGPMRPHNLDGSIVYCEKCRP